MPELTPQQKAQLDSNIRAMLGKGASQEDVMTYANDFKLKYDPALKKKGIGSLIGGVAGNAPLVGGGGEENKIAELLKTVKHSSQTQADIDRNKIKVDEAEYLNDPIGTSLKPIKNRQIELRERRRGIESTGQNSAERLVASNEISKLSQEEQALSSQRFGHSNDAKAFIQERLDPTKLRTKEGFVFPNVPQLEDFTEESRKDASPVGNATFDIAAKQYETTKKVKEAIANSGSLEEAALKDVVSSDDLQGKQLTALRGDIPNAMKGNIVMNFINKPELQEVARENPQLAAEIDRMVRDFPAKYPYAAITMLAEKVSAAREAEGDNNAILNAPSVKRTKEIVDELFEKGELPENYKKFFDNPGIALIVNMQLKTPGLVENFGSGLEQGLLGMGKSVADITGVRDLYSSESDRLYNTLEKDYQNFKFKPKGLLHNITTHGGLVTGQVVPMMVGGTAMKGLNIIQSERKANAIMAGLQTFGENRDRALADFPDASEIEQLGYATINTGVEVALANVLNDTKLARDLLKGTAPEIKTIIKKFTSKEINAAVAKQQVENVFSKAISVGGRFTKGVVKTAEKEAREEAATQILQTANNQVFGGQPQSVSKQAEDAFEVWRTTFLGSLFLGIGGGVVEVNKNPEMGKLVYEMAGNPEKYIDIIKGQAAIDPEYAKTVDEKLGNLQYAVDVKKELDGRDMKEGAKEKFLLKSLSEKMLLEKSKAIPDKSLAKDTEKQLAEIAIEKEKILNPDLPNTELVEEFYNEELLPKGSMELLSGRDADGKPTNKFDQSKVGEFLKFIAQQANNLDENWKPHEGDAPKLTVPDAIIEVANERWAKEIEAAQPDITGHMKFGEPEDISQPIELSVEPVPTPKGNTSNVVEGSGGVVEPRNVFEFIENSGYERDNEANDVRYVKDGVTIGLSPNKLNPFNKGSEMIPKDEKGFTINIISTDPSVRGKGEASKALKEITDYADKNGETIYLSANDATIGFKKGLNKKQLEEWYGRHGFEKNESIMVRKPQSLKETTKEETPTQEVVDTPTQPIDNEGEGTEKPPPEKPKDKPVGDGEGLPQRIFTKQMLRSDELTDVSKAEIAKTLNYTRQKNALSVKEANEVIDKVGLDEAQNLVMNDGDLKPAVRVTVGMTLIKRYNELSGKATEQGDKDYYLDKSIQTATFVTEKLATEPGQMIQAFSMWSRLSPEGQLRAANQDMARQGKEKLRRREKDIKVISDKFQKANEEAADEITKSETVKKSTQKADTKRTAKAKDKVAAARKKREQIIKKYKSEKGKNLYAGVGLTKEGIEYVGDLVKTYVQEGVAKLEIVIDRVLEDLKAMTGKDPNDDVKKNVYDIVKEHIDKDADKRITKGLVELEKSVNEIVKKHYTVSEEAKKSLVDKFIEQTGLEKEEAEQLAKEIETEFDKIATRKKRNILYNEKARFDKINSLKGTKQPEKKTVADDLIKYSNLGAFEGQDFADMVASKFGLGEISKEQAAKLMELAKKVEKAPEGSPKNAATEDLLSYRAKLKGNDLGETALAVYYANILSGYKTHEKNLISTFFQSVGELGTEMVKDPKSIPYLIAGYLNGVGRRGLTEARHTLATGRSPIHIRKIETPGTLERKQFWFGGWNPGNWFKYITRLMVAEDVLSFQGLKEARARQLASRVARGEGFNTWSKKGWDRVNEILFHTKEKWTEADTQATAEGLKGTEHKRRVYELMENQRPVEMTEDAYGFAAKGTFNHLSEGTLGALTNGLAHFLDAVSIGSLKPLRTIVPFTRIITNVVNNSLDYTPIGLVRAARGVRGFRSFEGNQITKSAFKELTKEERQRLVAKAAIGITLAAGLQALHIAGIIAITGAGPDDPKKKAQLMQEGWQPYSIKVGNKWYSYQYTPLVFMTGFLGNMNDAQEYNTEEDDVSFGKRMEVALSRMGGQVVDMTWINSASTFMGALAESNPAAQERKLSQAFAGMIRGFVPFSGAINQISQAAQSIWGMPQKQVTNAWQVLIQDIPIARNSLNDKINALGDPIVKDIDVITSKETTDPVWKYLLDKQGWVAPVNKGTIVIYDEKEKMYRPITGDEYYEFSKIRGKKVRKAIEDIMKNGAYVINDRNIVVRKKSDALTTKELNVLLTEAEGKATKEAKEKMFGIHEKAEDRVEAEKELQDLKKEEE